MKNGCLGTRWVFHMCFIASWLIRRSALLPCSVALILISRWESLFTNKYNEMCFSRSFILVWYWIRWVKRLFLLVLVEPPTWCGRCLYEGITLKTSNIPMHWTLAGCSYKCLIHDSSASPEDRTGRSPGCPRDSQGRRRAAEAPSKLEGSATSSFQAETIETAQAETSKTCAIPKPNLRHLCGAPPHPVARATWVMEPLMTEVRFRMFFRPCMESKRIWNFSRQNVLTTNNSFDQDVVGFLDMWLQLLR